MKIVASFEFSTFAQKVGIASRTELNQDDLMDARPIAISNARWTRQSIMAFLEGEQNLSWIVSVIQTTGDAESARQFVSELSGFGDPERRDSLLRRLEDAA